MAAEDKVGYGKPPKHSRFKKGRSGNPKGRPKGRKNLANCFFSLLNEKITIREGEKARRVTKGEAMIMSLLQKAMKGDVRSARLLFGALHEFGESEPAAASGLSGVLAVPGMMEAASDWEALAKDHEGLKRRTDDDGGD